MTVDEIIGTRLKSIAEDCFSDALEILQIIAVLEEQNRNNINRSLSAAGAGRAANSTKNSLIARLTLLVVRCYARPKKNKQGDLCASAAWQLIARDKRIEEELMRRNPAGALTSAKAHWLRCRDDVRLRRLEHFRDKFTAHRSEPDPEVPLPKFEELFAFAQETAKTLEMLSNVARARSDSLEEWIEELSGSATRFWRPWATQPVGRISEA